MKKLLLIISIIILSMFTLASTQERIFARRLFPVWSNPTICSENQIFYNMLTHKPLVCIGNNTVEEIGGGVISATYITQTPNAILTNEQALSTLSSGIMRVATTTGVITSLTDSAGIIANISDETGTSLLVFSNTPTLTSPIIANASALPAPVLGRLAVDTDDTKLYYAKDGSTFGEVFVAGLSVLNLGVPANFTGVLPLASGGTGANLVDPAADRIIFWDDSAGVVTFLTVGTNLTITGTTLDASGGGTTINATDNVIPYRSNSTTFADSFLTRSANGLAFNAVPTASATKAYFNLSNADLSGGSANGTMIGANPAAFTGDFIRYQVAGSNKFFVSNAGDLTASNSVNSSVFIDTALHMYLGSGVFNVKDSHTMNWSNDATSYGTKDLRLKRDAAGVLGVEDGSGNYRNIHLRAIQYSTGIRPTCDAAARGTTWYVAGGAGVLDTFEICRKDAADAYLWVTLF